MSLRSPTMAAVHPSVVAFKQQGGRSCLGIQVLSAVSAEEKTLNCSLKGTDVTPINVLWNVVTTHPDNMGSVVPRYLITVRSCVRNKKLNVRTVCRKNSSSCISPRPTGCAVLPAKTC